MDTRGDVPISQAHEQVKRKRALQVSELSPNLTAYERKQKMKEINGNTMTRWEEVEDRIHVIIDMLLLFLLVQLH